MVCVVLCVLCVCTCGVVCTRGVCTCGVWCTCGVVLVCACGVVCACELYSELDNPIVMESLCYSANKESEDAYDVSTSLTHNGSEYLLVALRRDTRMGFVKALTNKRSETVKEAMVDMQLLLRGVWRFHSDEGREFMGAVDSWLREHTVLHTTTSAYDPNANSLIEESVGARKRGIRCLLHQASAPVSLWPDAAEHANEIYNHSKRPVLGQNDTAEPIVLERKTKLVAWSCLAFAVKLEQPTVRRGSLEPIALQGIFVGWNTRVPHGIKIATFHNDGEVEEVFTSTTVRTRDTVFPLFSGAGMKPATETELQEFGESVRVRPDEEPSLALVENEETEGNLAHGEEMQDDQSREQPDPDELRRRAAEASADAAGARPTMMGGVGSASAETRRRITVKRPARPVDRREEQQSGGGDDPDRDEPPTRRQRDARAVVQLRAFVAMTGKTESTQCWGCNVVYDGGGFCDECITELQEQCVQDDVRLASYAAELARTVGTANAGDAYDFVSGPSLDHRDDVEQLMGHQAVPYVTKILDTNEAILTETGRIESLT